MASCTPAELPLKPSQVVLYEGIVISVSKKPLTKQWKYLVFTMASGAPADSLE
jgi:hypothetical protein